MALFSSTGKTIHPYIHDLSPDINESLRMASTMFYYSRRCLILVDYNEKRMQSNGDDLIFSGSIGGISYMRY